MKKVILTITTIACMIIASVVLTSWSGNENMKHQAGAPAGRCGDPANNFNDCTNACHSDNSSIQVGGWITANIPETGYTADSTYTIFAYCLNTSSFKSGFQVSPQNSHGTMMGKLINLSDSTQLDSAYGCWYINHTTIGCMSTTSSKTWTFQWKAPHTGDSVTFYGAFCASDNSNTDQGDNIYLSTLTVTNAAYAGISEISKEPAISIYPSLVTNNMHLSYSLSRAQNLTISLIDIHGAVCETLFQGNQDGGKQNLDLYLTGTHVAGIYFVRVNADGYNTIKKVILQ
jgi:hypothetical protein